MPLYKDNEGETKEDGTYKLLQILQEFETRRA